MRRQIGGFLVGFVVGLPPAALTAIGCFWLWGAP